VWVLREPAADLGEQLPLEVGDQDTASPAELGNDTARPAGLSGAPTPGAAEAPPGPTKEPMTNGVTARVDAALAAWRRGDWPTAIKLFQEDFEALPVGFTKQNMAFVYVRAQLAHGDPVAGLEALGHQLALLAQHSTFEPLGAARLVPRSSTLLYRDLKPFRGAAADPSSADLPAHHPYDHAGSASVLRRWYDAQQTLQLGRRSWDQGVAAAQLLKDVQAAAASAAERGGDVSELAASITRFVTTQMLLLTGDRDDRHAAFRREAKRFVRDNAASTHPDLRALADHLRQLLARRG